MASVLWIHYYLKNSIFLHLNTKFLVGFYYILFKGIVPAEWPTTSDTLLWKYLYYNAKLANNDLLFEEGTVVGMERTVKFDVVLMYITFINAIKAVIIKVRNESN